MSFLYFLFNPIKVVESIDLNSYTGIWEQVATSPSTILAGTGTDFKNVRATYEIIGDPKDNIISVFNEGINGNGVYESIKGISFSPNNNIPGKRKVKFENNPIEGNYWIVKLGPLNSKNQYDYAIVSGAINNIIGTRALLYVLARNRNVYKEKYEKEVKKWCFDNGYKFKFNKYVETE
jgi:lipocalin